MIYFVALASIFNSVGIGFLALGAYRHYRSHDVVRKM